MARDYRGLMGERVRAAQERDEPPPSRPNPIAGPPKPLFTLSAANLRWYAAILAVLTMLALALLGRASNPPAPMALPAAPAPIPDTPAAPPVAADDAPAAPAPLPTLAPAPAQEPAVAPPVQAAPPGAWQAAPENTPAPLVTIQAGVPGESITKPSGAVCTKYYYNGGEAWGWECTDGSSYVEEPPLIIGTGGEIIEPAPSTPAPLPTIDDPRHGTHSAPPRP